MGTHGRAPRPRSRRAVAAASADVVDAGAPSAIEAADAGAVAAVIPDDWRAACLVHLHRARMALRRDQPSFASEVVTFESDPIGIRFEMWVADAEHARFYRDPSEALYLVHVTERASAEAGRIGAAVGLPDDAQASVGESIWTTTRLAEYEAGVVQGGPAYDFVRAFLPAVRQCLR